MNTSSSAKKPDTAAKRLAIALSKIGLAIRHESWQAADQAGLSPTQGQILVILRRHRSGIRLGQIAEELGVTRATTSDAVTALVNKRLLRKEKDLADRRAIVIALTAEGIALSNTVMKWPDFLTYGLDSLSDDEQAVFLRGMTKIIRALQEKGQIPVSKMCITCRYFRPNAYSDARFPHHCDFLDSPFGNLELRIECDDHILAPTEQLEANWETFTHER